MGKRQKLAKNQKQPAAKEVWSEPIRYFEQKLAQAKAGQITGYIGVVQYAGGLASNCEIMVGEGASLSHLVGEATIATSRAVQYELNVRAERAEARKRLNAG